MQVALSADGYDRALHAALARATSAISPSSLLLAYGRLAVAPRACRRPSRSSWCSKAWRKAGPPRAVRCRMRFVRRRAALHRAAGAGPPLRPRRTGGSGRST
ncbi:MAG: poly-beta-hydroxybutyrate polymerase N-terminal domain-containing protein [Comamonadaceae bacterium]|nr:poly-beta-hydroxybutyrate polymerase N-terminal domain-containing protein [Comamonadaceae bacterium]